MKLTKRVLCALLCLLLLVGMMPAALAADAGGELVPTDKPVLDVSRSKTATALTSDWTSEVTLALPSAETPNTIDVVLVVDNAFAEENTTAADQALNLLSTLKGLSESGSLNVNASLIISGGYVPILYPEKAEDRKLQDIKDAYNNIYNALKLSKTAWKQKDGRKGSNIQAGIEVARDILAAEKTASQENKFLILISDGGAFSWYKDGVAYSKVYSIGYQPTDPVDKDNYYWCNPYDFQLRYGDGYSNAYSCNFTALMNKSEDEIDANSIPRNANWPSTIKNGTAVKTQYQGSYTKAQIDEYLGADFNGFASKVNHPSVSSDYITTREAALYHAAKSVQAAAEEDNVNVIFVSFAYYYNNNSNLFKITEAFKQYLSDSGYAKLYRVSGNAEDPKYLYPDNYPGVSENAEAVFNGIKKDMIQLVDAGSYVEDKMGSAFDFGGLDTMTLTVDGKPLDKKLIGGVLYFGDNKDTLTNTAYRFKVELTAADTFTWTINEAVTREHPVELTYKVTLRTPETTEGTYTVETNEFAILHPVSSAGVGGDALPFPVPELTYTVGSNGNPILPVVGTLPILWLNMEDHYSYIVGYPDGTVQPNGKITRAEVATIFFRLLSDDTREAFWSSTNSYSDVAADKWYNNAVSTLSRLGVISGYPDGTFRPDASITRAEFAKIAVSFCKYGSTTYSGCFSDVKASDWFSTCVETARNSNLIAGYPDGTFRPNNAITRAEACTIVNRTLGRKPAKNHMAISGRINWPDCLDTEWFYADMMEATNSHDYQMVGLVEDWNRKLPQRDWAALETEWSHAYSAPGGEVGR